MKDNTGESIINTQILEEASVWFVEFNEGDVDSAACRKFSRWLRTSPEHARAYLRVSALWDEAPLLSRSRRYSADELIARAQYLN
jgi:ferric-dicitrate binding protein FerR (iron transport regulator)